MDFLDDAHAKREKAKARELRQSRWWQTLAAKASCYYCGKALAKAEVTMDHIVPISQGGQSSRSNVVPACKACNTLKRDMTAVEWALLVEERRTASSAAAAELHHVSDREQHDQ
jgi:5-methylcytosine-specific restriction endonuclease McrA